MPLFNNVDFTGLIFPNVIVFIYCYKLQAPSQAQIGLS